MYEKFLNYIITLLLESVGFLYPQDKEIDSYFQRILKAFENNKVIVTHHQTEKCIRTFFNSGYYYIKMKCEELEIVCWNENKWEGWASNGIINDKIANKKLKYEDLMPYATTIWKLRKYIKYNQRYMQYI